MGRGVTKTQPFLKWAGGKRQLLPELRKHVPANHGQYIEPFLGGGALFFNLQPQKAILCDLNQGLVDCFMAVKNHVAALIARLARYENDEDAYYAVREQNPNRLGLVGRAARTIYLNRTCYNGLYRVNRKGHFNVPFGRRANPVICNEEVLRAASKALKKAKLISSDYKGLLQEHARPGDFIFLDPPYYPAGGYADFQRYTKECFGEEDHVTLRDETRRLVDMGCSVLLTNSNADFVRRLYRGFKYQVVKTRRNISCDATTRTGEDLIVFGANGKKKHRSKPVAVKDGLLKNFPGTRYMGSKSRILPFLWDCVKDLPFESVLDAFSGSGCVSYMFKRQGKQVFSNDFLHFTYHFAKAFIQNSSVRLTDEDLAMLMRRNSKAGTFIARTFKGLYFSDKENRFLDSLRANIDRLGSPYKKSLALAAAARACTKRRPRGIFTYVGHRYDDGRRDVRIDLMQQFRENVEAFNRAVFSNGKNNRVMNSDVFNVEVSPDLVYFDPPYYTPNSDNDYTRRYHFVEGFVRKWEGLELQYNTKTKKFRRYDTPFLSKNTIHEAFDGLFRKFNKSILVVSYSSNSIPGKRQLVSMLKKYKKHVTVREVDHVYSFGTHRHKVGDNANRVQEYVFVAY